jgi:hypothetical protein
MGLMAMSNFSGGFTVLTVSSTAASANGHAIRPGPGRINVTIHHD